MGWKPVLKGKDLQEGKFYKVVYTKYVPYELTNGDVFRFDKRNADGMNDITLKEADGWDGIWYETDYEGFSYIEVPQRRIKPWID
jgi:hypothetical protein